MAINRMLQKLFVSLFLLNFNSKSVAGTTEGGNSAITQSSNSSAKPFITDELKAVEFLKTLDVQANTRCAVRVLKEWNYASNITVASRANATNAGVAYGKFWKTMSEEAAQYKWQDFKNESTKRQFMFATMLGSSVLSEEKIRKFNSIRQTMEGIYNSAKVCQDLNKTKSQKCELSLEPELTEIMRLSRDPNQLKSMWLQWRDQTGKKMRENYSDLANIVYEAAIANKFPDASHYDTRAYERATLKEDLEKIWEQLTPFYNQLHAYVRRKLRDYYLTQANLNISNTAPIPAHLLGNMWSQSWSNIYDIVVPFPNKKSIDVTPNMFAQKLNPYNMTLIAEEFFMSIGFPPLPQEFWNGSILAKPEERDIICHASAWDMCDKKNFWIKQCTRVTMEDLITLHHEMGHIQYQIQYRNLPKLFRDGANPGFHEAIGDLIALSVQTPKHLHRIGLLNVLEDDKDADINYLLFMALEKVAFLPFAYLVDKWRWDVFQKVIKPEDYNCAWWELRTKLQGISPPETRTEKDFDPGAKYHVAVNSGYTKYFVSAIIQFQFHQALCQTAKQYDPAHPMDKPLYKCDIYENKEAGHKLMSMLQMGASRPWPDAMEKLTGQRLMTAEPMIEYFRPLLAWLENENKLHNTTVGWKNEKPSCVKQPKGKSGSTLPTIPQLSFTKMILISLVLILIK